MCVLNNKNIIIGHFGGRLFKLQNPYPSVFQISFMPQFNMLGLLAECVLFLALRTTTGLLGS